MLLHLQFDPTSYNLSTHMCIYANSHSISVVIWKWSNIIWVNSSCWFFIGKGCRGFVREWLRQLVKIQRSAEAAAGQNRGWSKHFQSLGSAGLFGPLDPSDTEGWSPSAFCTYRLFPWIEKLLTYFNKYLHMYSLDWPFRCLDQVRSQHPNPRKRKSLSKYYCFYCYSKTAANCIKVFGSWDAP